MHKSGVRGLWHVALRVTDLVQSELFYVTLFGMQVVWRPDPDNVYLSSGADNLALHQLPAAERAGGREAHGGPLDHLGVIVESAEAVQRLFAEAQRSGHRIVKEPKQHRDGSYSFYLADPDGNTVQVLYEPTISHLDVARSVQGKASGET